jgi:hypothetical protein
MANEAHSGMTRCIRTREVGARMIRAAHEAGVRRLAMEALPNPDGSNLGPISTVPSVEFGYLGQPEMRRLMTTALDLGWSLWAYEAVIDRRRAELQGTEAVNWREREQARSLCQVLAAAPAEPLLVWCGNSHAKKDTAGEWTPMGYHFAARSGTDPFVIDQTITVDFPGRTAPWVSQLLDGMADVLAGLGGTAAIRRDQAPEPLNRWSGVDALVVSTDNAMT